MELCVVVESGESIEHHYYWVNDEKEQDTAFMFRFVEFVASISDCPIDHYGSYETAFLKSSSVKDYLRNIKHTSIG